MQKAYRGACVSRGWTSLNHYKGISFQPINNIILHQKKSCCVFQQLQTIDIIKFGPLVASWLPTSQCWVRPVFSKSGFFLEGAWSFLYRCNTELRKCLLLVNWLNFDYKRITSEFDEDNRETKYNIYYRLFQSQDSLAVYINKYYTPPIRPTCRWPGYRDSFDDDTSGEAYIRFIYECYFLICPCLNCLARFPDSNKEYAWLINRTVTLDIALENLAEATRIIIPY